MELKFNISSHDQGFSISYIDQQKHKIAISEVSYMPKDLILDSLSDFDISPEIIEKIKVETHNHEHFAFYSRLNVPESMQGKGLGATLLKETLSFCEQNNIFLLNTINPYGTLDKEQLIQFYSKHGMTSLDNEGLLIFYVPPKPALDADSSLHSNTTSKMTP